MVIKFLYIKDILSIRAVAYLISTFIPYTKLSQLLIVKLKKQQLNHYLITY